MAAWLIRVSRHDERVLHALLLRRRGWMDVTMRASTHLGDAITTVSAAVLLLVAGPPGIGGRAAATLAGSHLLVQVLKRSVARPRPRLPVGIDSLIHAPDRFSFPSGHAAAALSIALPLASLAPVAVAGAILALALVVGLSRCYLGVHYPGDVAMGWLLAFVTYAAVSMLPGGGLA